MEPRDLSKDAALVEASLAPCAPSDAPFIVMLTGLPGTGKSSLSQRLRKRLPTTIVESDAVRAMLFPKPTFSITESGYVFRVCMLVMERLLRRDFSVVMDATNLREAYREPVYAMAERSGAALHIVRVHAPARIVRERLERRAATAGERRAAVADWNVYRRMRYTRERIARDHLRVDTSGGLDGAVEAVVAAVAGGASSSNPQRHLTSVSPSASHPLSVDGEGQG